MNDLYTHGCLDTLTHLIEQFKKADPAILREPGAIIAALEREYELVAKARDTSTNS